MNLTQFIPNPGFIKILENTPFLDGSLQALAAEGANAARENAPVLTGAYRDSIVGETGYNEDGIYIGRINAYDYKAWWIEAGTEDTPAFGTLQQGLDAIGLRAGP
jgi:hypothetical protein